MEFLFYEEFSLATLRAAGFAAHGGADLGGVLVTAAAITHGMRPAGTARGKRPRASASRPWLPAPGRRPGRSLRPPGRAGCTLDGTADQITAPTLIIDGENDQFLKGGPKSPPCAHQRRCYPGHRRGRRRARPHWRLGPGAPDHVRLARHPADPLTALSTTRQKRPPGGVAAPPGARNEPAAAW